MKSVEGTYAARGDEGAEPLIQGLSLSFPHSAPMCRATAAVCGYARYLGDAVTLERRIVARAVLCLSASAAPPPGSAPPPAGTRGIIQSKKTKISDQNSNWSMTRLSHRMAKQPWTKMISKRSDSQTTSAKSAVPIIFREWQAGNPARPPTRSALELRCATATTTTAPTGGTTLSRRRPRPSGTPSWPQSARPIGPRRRHHGALRSSVRAAMATTATALGGALGGALGEPSSPSGILATNPRRRSSRSVCGWRRQLSSSKWPLQLLSYETSGREDRTNIVTFDSRRRTQ